MSVLEPPPQVLCHCTHSAERHDIDSDDFECFDCECGYFRTPDSTLRDMFD